MDTLTPNQNKVLAAMVDLLEETSTAPTLYAITLRTELSKSSVQSAVGRLIHHGYVSQPYRTVYKPEVRPDGVRVATLVMYVDP